MPSLEKCIALSACDLIWENRSSDSAAVSHCAFSSTDSHQRRGSEGTSGAWGVSFHVFHCGWWLHSLKRPIKQEDWKQWEKDPFDYPQRPLLELFYGGDGWLVALGAPGSLTFFIVFLLADCFGTHKTFKNGHMQLNISLCTKWQSS